ncbi:MAG: cytochrome c4 [Rubrivivax sp.]|nr:cytochrome c4 [Rubrivivax sp.]
MREWLKKARSTLRAVTAFIRLTPLTPISALATLACAAGIACTAVGGAQAHEVAKTVCGPCHGVDGNNAVPLFPRLAGIQAEYITKQLQDYLSGKRKSEVMAPTVSNLKADDIPQLAAYFAAQKPAAGTPAEDAQLAAAGKALYDDGNTGSGVPACVGCHQEGGAGNARYPRVAGQHAAYTTAQMLAFKKGERTNDRARVMRAVAERMTEQEIQAVSAWLASL